ncbi:alpha/beta fold hydrolase [Sporolactobacillus shoreae]|nr:alpha/beta hydrolase [Sporolactobacillus shoreae]
MAKTFIKKFTIPKFWRVVGRIMLILLSLLLACILIVVSVLFAWSPGKPAPFLNESGKVLKGSISEKIYVNINGVKQGMFIESKNKANPVLLFLHGGPGMPEYAFTQKYPTSLENYFTVCYWEQRGSGLSYSADISPKTMTAEQLVSDTLAVTNYLRKRFGQEKIYLMGHSWGSFLGMQAAARAPQLYHAYIGMGQVSQQFESEKMAYTYMLGRYKATGNERMVKKLEAYPITKSDGALNSYLSSSLRDEAMHDLGIGTTHRMKSVITGIFLPVMQCRAYTLSEKINIWRGKAFLNNSTDLRKQMYTTDLSVKVPKLDIPVYFFSGKYDYTVSHTLAKKYFDKLQAPMKGFYTFDHSAHSPLFEEPAKFVRIMREDVLNGTVDHADSHTK